MPGSLSIIVPTVDEALGIGSTLRRLQPLRARDVELLVVDGGSSDGTVALAQPLADRVLSAERGRARQLNAGAAVASGEVLLFLHADTLLPDDADRAVLAGLAVSDRCWGRFDVRISGRSRLLPAVAAGMNLRSRLTGIATGDQAIFVTREAFRAVGGFPEQPLMEDVEISTRLRRLSPPLCLRGPVVTSGRRWDRRGALRTILLMWSLRWAYWRGESPAELARRYR